MTPPEANDERLAELRRRWEEEPGSRIFLQLSEEYRHRDRHGDALEVLQKGLEAHPHQVSGLVALGRVHLEMDHPAEASRALEKALDIDATNAVAMKLAVEAYLRQGDRDQAKQRLELYKLLNSSDPEIEELEARVARRATERPQAAAPPPPPPPPAPESSSAEAGPDGAPGEPEEAGSASGSVGSPSPPAALEESPANSSSPSAPLHPGGEVWSPTAAWPGLPRDTGAASELAQGADRDGDDEAAPAFSGEEAPEAGAAEPFGDLLSAGERRRYLEGLGSEGLFPVELEPEPEPEPEPESAPEPELEAEPALRAEAAPPGEIPPASAAEAVATPAPGAVPEGLEGGATPSQGVPGPPPAPVEPLAGAGDRPTVTLGQLYLEQGHPGEALRIFEAVLDRDRENVQARIGLLRARAAVSTGESAQRGAAVPEEAPPAPAPPAAALPPSPAAPAETAPAAPSVEPAFPEARAGEAEPLSPDEAEALPAAGEWDQPSAAMDRLQQSAPPAEPATGGLSEAGHEDAPDRPVLTAADLLRDADPALPPKRALLDAYRTRLRGHRSP